MVPHLEHAKLVIVVVTASVYMWALGHATLAIVMAARVYMWVLVKDQKRKTLQQVLFSLSEGVSTCQ